jgi:very-short-patch-repair endonuclease
MPHLPVPPETYHALLERARSFRKESTSSEERLWQALRRKQLAGRKFRRQQPIGGFIVDFFCATERLIVEVDGLIHDQQQAADTARQEYLESHGLRFVRVTAEQVETDLTNVLATIVSAFLIP